MELNKHELFKIYKRKEEVFDNNYKPEISELANKVIEVIKEKEPTYEEAYAVLNLVHAKLQYESNFVRVQSNVKK
ncbi:hypothetical protein [Mammaliicoccus sciuri]|uniref:hypothetical protein n=1 Tax=Mammaliicoccus sciuri TaxID=1296 RepID=UPI001952A4F2|nr:hypothetical protein [Mammaliicoccus sciuri]